MRTTHRLAAALLIGALGTPAIAGAAIIADDLGNTASGFSDGDILTTLQIAGAQSGQPAPFDQGYGTDGLFGGNFDQSWMHSFGAIADPILSAVLTIGIADHDSAASGSQLSLLDLDGSDETAALDAQFEAPGDGEQTQAGSEFNIYSLDLLGLGLGGDLADGVLNVRLALQGPGLVPNLLLNTIDETNTNGAHLIFSSLAIETQDQQPPRASAPATFGLLTLGLLGIVARRARRG